MTCSLRLVMFILAPAPLPVIRQFLDGALAATLVRSASLSTTKTLFSTAKTARQARVHCSSPLESSPLFDPSLLDESLVVEDPRPMIDIEDNVGICIADIPGNRIEWPDIRSFRILMGQPGVMRLGSEK